jgi:hypothetical protein
VEEKKVKETRGGECGRKKVKQTYNAVTAAANLLLVRAGQQIVGLILNTGSSLHINPPSPLLNHFYIGPELEFAVISVFGEDA